MDIGRDAFESLICDVEDFLFPIEEEEEELRVEDMNPEQLRQYYHEQGIKRMENMTEEEKAEHEKKFKVNSFLK